MFWGHLSIGVLSADCRAGVQERGEGWTLLLLAERPGQDESTYHMHEEGAEGPGSDPEDHQHLSDGQKCRNVPEVIVTPQPRGRVFEEGDVDRV